MSASVTTFANSWVAENIHPGPYDPPREEINGHVERMIADAQVEGIGAHQLEEELGDLSDFIAEAMEEATDNEVERLASKDD